MNRPHTELGSFLRSARAGIDPETAGLPASRRRRRGLRREEVALLAGISATWYTWLEQGRDIRASAHTLNSLADALHLDAAARRHLFQLARGEHPPLSPAPSDQPVPAYLTEFVDHLDPDLAVLLNHRLDVIALNGAAAQYLGSYLSRPPEKRNIVENLCTDPALKDLLADGWEPITRDMIAQLRMQAARYTDDPAVTALIERLNHNTAFATWWKKHTVRAPGGNHVTFHHPRTGHPTTYQHMAYIPADADDLRLLIYTPIQ